MRKVDKSFTIVKQDGKRYATFAEFLMMFESVACIAPIFIQ